MFLHFPDSLENGRRATVGFARITNSIDSIFPGNRLPSGLQGSILKRRVSFDHNQVTFAKESFLQTLRGFGDGYILQMSTTWRTCPHRFLLAWACLRSICKGSKIETCTMILRNVSSYDRNASLVVLCIFKERQAFKFFKAFCNLRKDFVKP